MESTVEVKEKEAKKGHDQSRLSGYNDRWKVNEGRRVACRERMIH